MGQNQNHISVRLWHKDRKAREFTEALQLVPQIVHSVGEPRETPTGTPLEGRYTQSYWCFDYEGEQEPSEAIRDLLPRLEEKRTFFESFVQTGGKAEVLIWVVAAKHFGEEVAPDILSRLGRLGIGLSFDVYFDDRAKE